MRIHRLVVMVSLQATTGLEPCMEIGPRTTNVWGMGNGQINPIRVTWQPTNDGSHRNVVVLIGASTGTRARGVVATK